MSLNSSIDVKSPSEQPITIYQPVKTDDAEEFDDESDNYNNYSRAFMVCDISVVVYSTSEV